MKAYYYNNFNTGSEKQIVIINENQIESKKLCETYDDFGQQCGCYAAGCYSIDNCESNFMEDLKNAVEEQFGFIPAYDVESDGDVAFVNFDSYVEDEEAEKIDVEPIEKFINEWIKENTSHCDAEVFEYHDGSNWHSLAISVEGVEPALEEVEEELNEKILEEYEDADWGDWQAGIITGESELFTFKKSQWLDDWTIAIVDEK